MMLNGLIPEIYFMKIRFVDGALKTLESRKVAYNVHDPEGTGLTLRVLPHGRKNWVLSYRSPIGIKQQRPIGRFPAMRIAEAREAALSALSVRPRSF
jgi:hypothetical protein